MHTTRCYAYFTRCHHRQIKQTLVYFFISIFIRLMCYPPANSGLRGIVFYGEGSKLEGLFLFLYVLFYASKRKPVMRRNAVRGNGLAVSRCGVTLVF